nr:PREDICTED: uncharacterized protein LOC103314259 [Tribolium castaneum]|eukprot:XP_008198011.2 PREDICTED: uncharacterized protein LOC103314259 [Tribolium castaneum]
MSQITIMKVMLIVLLTLSIFYQNLIVDAFVARGPPNPKRKPGGCYEDNFGHLKGNSQTKIRCVLVGCSSSGWINVQGCPLMAIDVGCFEDIKEDPKKPFPECCAKQCDSPAARFIKASKTTTPRPPQKTSKPPNDS